MGDDWKFVLQSENRFRKTHTEEHLQNATAITVFDEKTIWFLANQFTEYHVIHELVHARFGYKCLNDASMRPDQMEEVFAEYMGEYGEKHLEISKKIFKKMSPFAKKMK